MKIFSDVFDTYSRVYKATLNPAQTATNFTKAMDDNPRIMKQLMHGFEIPMGITTVAGMAVGMSSEDHKVAGTTAGATIGGIAGAPISLAIAGNIAKRAKII